MLYFIVMCVNRLLFGDRNERFRSRVKRFFTSFHERIEYYLSDVSFSRCFDCAEVDGNVKVRFVRIILYIRQRPLSGAVLSISAVHRCKGLILCRQTLTVIK